MAADLAYQEKMMAEIEISEQLILRAPERTRAEILVQKLKPAADDNPGNDLHLSPDAWFEKNQYKGKMPSMDDPDFDHKMWLIFNSPYEALDSEGG